MSINLKIEQTEKNKEIEINANGKKFYINYRGNNNLNVKLKSDNETLYIHPSKKDGITLEVKNG